MVVRPWFKHRARVRMPTRRGAPVAPRTLPAFFVCSEKNDHEIMSPAWITLVPLFRIVCGPPMVNCKHAQQHM